MTVIFFLLSKVASTEKKTGTHSVRKALWYSSTGKHTYLASFFCYQEKKAYQIINQLMGCSIKLWTKYQLGRTIFNPSVRSNKILSQWERLFSEAALKYEFELEIRVFFLQSHYVGIARENFQSLLKCLFAFLAISLLWRLGKLGPWVISIHQLPNDFLNAVARLLPWTRPLGFRPSASIIPLSFKRCACFWKCAFASFEFSSTTFLTLYYHYHHYYHYFKNDIMFQIAH